MKIVLFNEKMFQIIRETNFENSFGYFQLEDYVNIGMRHRRVFCNENLN